MKKWEDCPREDLSMIPQMEKSGWIIDLSYADKKNNRTTPENVPHDAVSFHKGDKYTWEYISSKGLMQ